MEKNTSLATSGLRYAFLTAMAAGVVFLFSRVLPVNQTTVALAFLVLVLLTAYRWRLAYSVYLSLLCAALYNFFFLPPVGRITIADPQNWIALAAFLSTSVLVSHLSNRERRQAEASEARRRDVELLYRLSQKLLVQDEVNEVARSIPSIIASVFQFRAVALYVSAADTVFYSDPDRILASANELRSSAAQEMQTRDGYKLIPLRMGMHHPLGQLAIAGDETTPAMCEAIGSLVSVALEGANALERSSRLEAARNSERLRTALVESVTHDLRTPLTAIRAAATTLLAEPQMEASARNDLVEVVNEESERLDRLIGQAVEMAKLDSQSMQIHLAPQDVSELIELTVEQMQPSLRGRQVQIHVPDRMPMAWMDRTLIQRVLQHLLENAATYSPPQEAIEVSARLQDSRLVIAVEDRGPGIDPQELPFIFDKYFRGKHHNGRVRGTGMGLAIAQAIVKAHGGAISAESTVGKGTQFSFWIPNRP
jgi:two-component system sensor histidine kinase KdpD